MRQSLFQGIHKILAHPLLILIAILTAATSAMSAEQDEKDAITKVIEAHYDAWNRHNAKEMAALYAEDGDLRTPWNEIGKNRQEVEAVYNSEFAKKTKNAHVDDSIKSIRIVKPDIAFVDVESTITGMQTSNEKKYPDLHHHVIFLLVKREGKWQILAGRPF